MDIMDPIVTEEVESPENWKLFVGQIPRNIQQEELFELFKVYGDLEEIFIIRDQATGLSKGCCFVRYKQKSSAEACIKALNKFLMDGATNPLQISYAAQNSSTNNMTGRNSATDSEIKLFVGQVPQTYQDADLRALFDQYGTVREVFIMRNRETGASRGAGFVKLEADNANVRRAITELNGLILEGTPIKVDVAHSRPQMSSPRGMGPMGMMGGISGQALMHRYPMQAPVMGYQQGNPTATWYPQPPQLDRKNTSDLPKLFVGGLTPHTTEAQLQQIFSHYGQVREVVVLRYPNGQSKASGFVKYATEQEADVAVASLSSRYSLPGSTRPLSVRYAGTAHNPPEHKLFVGHLPPTFDESQTELIFRQFGDVLEAHVMRDQRGQTKGSAFVKFAQRSQAEAAIQALHGSTQFGERPLKVSFALSRAAQQHHQLMGLAHLSQQLQPPPPMPIMVHQQQQVMQHQQQQQQHHHLHHHQQQQQQPQSQQPQQQQQQQQSHQHQQQQQPQLVVAQTRSIVNGNGHSPTQAQPADHIQMQQHMGAAYFYPTIPYFPIQPGTDGGPAQLPVSF